MKYQIMQSGDQFFPMYRNCLGFWRHFTESNGYYNEEVAFKTKEESVRFLTKEKSKRLQKAMPRPKPKVTIHPYP